MQHVVAGERVLEAVVLDLERQVAELLAIVAEYVQILGVEQGEAAVVEAEPGRVRVPDATPRCHPPCGGVEGGLKPQRTVDLLDAISTIDC